MSTKSYACSIHERSSYELWLYNKTRHSRYNKLTGYNSEPRIETNKKFEIFEREALPRNN